jgi:aryl-alcohol dehydrogenase-like predicted oxidoreductase
MTLQQGLLTGKFASADEMPVNQKQSRHFHWDGHQGAEKEMFEALVQLKDAAASAGCTMSQMAIAWTFCRAGIAASLTGNRTLEELDENIVAASVSLSDDTVARIDEISHCVYDRLGNIPDYYLSGERCRIY